MLIEGVRDSFSAPFFKTNIMASFALKEVIFVDGQNRVISYTKKDAPAGSIIEHNVFRYDDYDKLTPEEILQLVKDFYPDSPVVTLS